ncbi:hypothetical protein IEQ11_01290 [Lysobacter capsici]|uniref:hypothetical protein n=1 Tax=Lysobacter capsici TaxID=435897 RepID=UPI00177DF9C8|nr:hypothetical protein [Lysobacter capsici]UOF15330.1 hypothetical protein IEQ11_01290 [Lysobacter capsici]
MSAGETIGGVVGIPLPLAKVGCFGKFRALDNVVADIGGVGSKVRIGPWSKGASNVVEGGFFEQCLHVNWQQKYVQFKNEGGMPNILLGKGAGIEIFRSNIVGYTVVSQGRDK